MGPKPKLLNPRSTFVAVHARLTFTSPEDERAVPSWFNQELLSLEQKMGGERNEYKLNRLRAEKEELEKAFGYLKKFLSLQGSSGGPKREVTARRNPEELKGDSLPLWRALQVGVLRPLLGRVPRDLSALKPLLVGGAWNGGGGASLGPVRYAGPARMEVPGRERPCRSDEGLEHRVFACATCVRPMRVGKYRTTRGPGTWPSGSAHACGEVPAYAEDRLARLEFSPCVWGGTAGALALLPQRCVQPMRVGRYRY